MSIHIEKFEKLNHYAIIRRQRYENKLDFALFSLVKMHWRTVLSFTISSQRPA